VEKSVEDNLGITTRLKAKAGLLQLGTQLLMIEDFTVKDENYVAVATLQRLIAGIEIKNS